MPLNPDCKSGLAEEGALPDLQSGSSGFRIFNPGNHLFFVSFL